ncbi:hypothetical protein E2C01_059124 [Portunus trituberculatus]|uniref:Uncharacterized protein n=1 Tax=Portunus trituberculatus TaxID=210409 RepID=A0A5B7GX93_PORTR|nr:hypothetical protein [Portunus trituberculatus]
MKPRSCPEVGFARPHSTQAEVLSELSDFWKAVEVKASTSEHTASWNTALISGQIPPPPLFPNAGSTAGVISSIHHPHNNKVRVTAAGWERAHFLFCN